MMLATMIKSLVDYVRLIPDEASPEASEAALRDFSGAAGLYFVRIRTPAAWIAGSSLGAFFSFSKFNLDQRSSALDQLLYKSYLGFALSSFLLSFATIVLATGASVAALHPHNHQKAESVWTLLHREFEFEFVVTRWAYWMALLCFLVAVTHRAVLEFSWTQPQQRNPLRAFLCIMLAVITQLLSHIHQHMYSFRNLGHMTAYVLQMMVRRSVHDPLQAISMAATVLAAYYGLQALWQKETTVTEEVAPALDDNDNGEKCKGD